jgi:hypothetical protein
VIRSSSWLMGAMALVTLLSAVAQERPADFTGRWPLELAGAGPWHRLELPLSSELGARQADLGDLRVFNGAGEPVPYAIWREAVTHAVEAQAEVKWFALYDAAEAGQRVPQVRIQRASNGSVTDVQPAEELEAGEEILRGWLLDTSAVKGPLIRLNFDWTSERDGFQHFSIEASDDLQQWQSWGTGQVGRFSFADERIEQHEVDLAGKPARYLRLLWQNPQAAPILSSVQVSSSLEMQGLPRLGWSEPIGGRSGKINEFIWQLPASLPVERLKWELEQGDSLAPVAVFGRNDPNGTWQPLQNGLLYRLSQNGQDAVQDQMALSGQGVRQIMLQVDDRGGGLGTTAPRLQVAVRPVEVLFMARGEGPYTLAVGSDQVRSAALTPQSADLASAGTASLAPATARPAGATLVSASPPVIDQSTSTPGSTAPEGGPSLLWLAVLVGILLLAVVALRLNRARSARAR